jgi:hypothetical protein
MSNDFYTLPASYGCPYYEGISVRFQQESLSALRKNYCPEWSGISVRFGQEYALVTDEVETWGKTDDKKQMLTGSEYLDTGTYFRYSKEMQGHKRSKTAEIYPHVSTRTYFVK